MERVVVELKGNLTFCGINKGLLQIEGEEGLLVETDAKLGLKVWCPKEAIVETYDVVLDE